MRKLLFLTSTFTYLTIIHSFDKESIQKKEDIKNECIKKIEDIKNECIKKIEDIKNLPNMIEKRKNDAEIKLQIENEDVIKHEVQFYTDKMRTAHFIKNNIELLNIKESEYTNNTLRALENILHYCTWEDDITKKNSLWGIRDFSSMMTQKTSSMGIEKELLSLEIELKKDRTINYINKCCNDIINYITTKENEYFKKATQLKNYIEEETNKIKNFITEKEKNIENILHKSIFSLSRISLCIILSLFSYSAYNRLMRLFNNNSIKKTPIKSFFIFLKKNTPYIIDSCLIIGSTIYAVNTSSYLHNIWQKKD